MEAIQGVTLEMAAELDARRSALQTQHGSAVQQHFAMELAARGLDEATWAFAWNAWQTRAKAEPTGQLEARYHMLHSKYSRLANYGDVQDLSQTEKGGLTLDRYALLCAGLTKLGDAPVSAHEALLAQHGLSMEQWGAGRDAWNAAMAQDTHGIIAVQYGDLYSKHNPEHEKAMQDQLAAQLVSQRTEGPPDDEEEEEYTLEKALQELESPTPTVRWDASRHVTRMVRNLENQEPERYREVRERLMPVLLEALERHDKNTCSHASSAAECLATLKAYSREVETTLKRCHGRAKEHLALSEAAFQSVADQSVPERIGLQRELSSWSDLVQQLEQVISEVHEAQKEPPKESSTVEPERTGSPSAAPVVAQEAGPTGLIALLGRMFGVGR